MKAGQEVLAKGWVRTKRGNKEIVFVALNDGSTIKNIQIVIDKNADTETILPKITTGACIGVKGNLVESVGSGQAVEIHADEITLYSSEKGYFTGVFENGGSHASPYKHFRRHTQASQPDGLRHTRVFPQKRIRLSQHTSYNHLGLRRSGTDVSGHHSRPQ